MSRPFRSSKFVIFTSSLIQYGLNLSRLFYLWFNFIYSQLLPQLRLYFDFTSIVVTHTKNFDLCSLTEYRFYNSIQKANLLFRYFQRMTSDMYSAEDYSPYHDDIRLLAITCSSRRVAVDYPFLFYPCLEICFTLLFGFSLFWNMLHV